MNKLTIWQKLLLPFAWLLWASAPPENKKTWKQFVNGLIKHEHRYTIPDTIEGCKVLRCEHEGCNYVDPTPDMEDLIARLDKLIEKTI